MSAVLIYKFKENLGRCLGYVHDLDEEFGKEFRYPFMKFVVQAQMFDSADPHFMSDSKVLHTYSGIECIQNKEPSKDEFHLNVDMDALKDNAPSTWQRFEENTKDMPCVVMHKMSREDVSELQYMQAEIHEENSRAQKPMTFSDRVTNGFFQLKRFIMS